MEYQQTAQPKLFIGIDIHKRSWKVHCATDLFAGKSLSMSSDPEQLRRYVSKHFPDYEVSTAYEAGCCGYYAHRCFEGYGWRSLVVNPADIHRKGKEKHTKTDRIDAQLIARELKDGRFKSYIKMQLLYFGIKEPEEFDNDHWSHKYRAWLDDMDFKHPTARATLDSRMRFFRFVDQELRDVSTQLRRYCKVHYKKDYLLLRSIPGIGGIVACGILCELGDLRRFNSVKHLAGYVGLAPGVYQSGGTSRVMGITPRAHRLIRSYFVEASWQAIRADPVMQSYYRKHQGKNVKSIIIKVARKLLSRTLAVIKTEIPYTIGVVE